MKSTLRAIYHRIFYDRAKIPEFDTFFERLLNNEDILITLSERGSGVYWLIFDSKKTGNSYSFGVKSGVLQTLETKENFFSREINGKVLGLNFTNHVKLWDIYYKKLEELKEMDKLAKLAQEKQLSVILARHP